MYFVSGKHNSDSTSYRALDILLVETMSALTVLTDNIAQNILFQFTLVTTTSALSVLFTAIWVLFISEDTLVTREMSGRLMRGNRWDPRRQQGWRRFAVILDGHHLTLIIVQSDCDESKYED